MFMSDRAVPLLSLLVLLCGSALAQKVKTGHDKTTDFSKYQTYSWAEQDRPTSRPFLREHVIGSIDYELQQKGLKRVQHGGDLTVVASGGVGMDSNFASSTPIFPSYGGAPISMDSTMWTGAGGGSSGVYVPEGSLGVDLVDTAANKLVWRGSVAEKLDMEKKTESLERVSKAIAKLFKDYPPKKD